eukprot:CCRYP_017569-RA/>CCRYP_017569-RA protein AED:0.02 eAED:0.02 QI:244/1/1/1/1/1/2/6/1001
MHSSAHSSIPILAVLIAALLQFAHSSDHNFCGESWEDASSSCQDRQHCPSGSDEECTVSGQICFADTLCDASKGDGVQAGSASLATIADIPYDDLSNRKFCGSWWASSQENCALDTFCGHDENSCKDFTQCYETQCHVQDLAAKELGENWKEVLLGGGEEKPAKLSQDDPRRHNFCGTDWADANSKCNLWCLGEDTDCPPGLGCFGDTSCYYDDDLVPTLSPTVSPPTTDAPVTADDPINSQFCGETWESAIKTCSIETNCKFDSDCPDNHVCFGYLPNCNLSKMAKEATAPEQDSVQDEAKPIVLIKGDPSNNSFCGSTWLDAVDNCSLDTHCPDNVCSGGKSCFQFIQSKNCDAYDLMMATNEPSSAPSILTNSPTRVVTSAPTLQPSNQPSQQPTFQPSKQPTNQPVTTPTSAPISIVYGLCARDVEHLQQIYRYATMCSVIDPCPDNLTCFDSIDYGSLSQTKTPTKEPSKRPSTLSPTHVSTKIFSSVAPMLALDETTTIEPTPSTNSDFPTSPLLALGQPETVAMTHSSNSEFPTHAPQKNEELTTSAPTEEKMFYCAINERELEVSCDWALECTDGIASCPEGYSCIQYDCDQPYKPSDTELCPLDFVGFISNSDLDCKLYYECKNGVQGASNTCTDGLKYDILRQMCWYEDEVDANCYGPPMDTPEPTGQPSSRPTYFFNASDPELCPFDYLGASSTGDVDCKLYYECNNGTLVAVNTCTEGLKYDILRQMCWYEDEVDANCYGPPMDTPEPTGQPSSRPTYFFNASDPELCPFDYLGASSTGDVDCKLYYECNNGTLGAVNTCTEGLKYDILRQMCWYEDEVDANCYGPPISPEISSVSEPQSKYNTSIGDNETLNNELVFVCLEAYTGWAVRDGCKQYYWCANGTVSGNTLDCGEGKLFDLNQGICVLSKEIQCNETENAFPETLSSLASNNRYVWPEDSSSNNDESSPIEGQWHILTQAFLESPAAHWTSRTKALVWATITLIVNLMLDL